MATLARRLGDVIGPGLIAAIAVVQSLPVTVWSSRQVIPADYNLLDSSWNMQMSASLAQGGIAGRDFLFTYGPLHQLLDAGVGVLTGGDWPELVRYQKVGLHLAYLLLVWAAAVLLTRSWAWRWLLF